MADTSTRAWSDERRRVRSRAEQARCRRYRRAEDAAAREALVTRYLPLARRLAWRHDELEDLVQVASLALVKAVDRFEPERGVSFASFAAPTIVGEQVLDALASVTARRPQSLDRPAQPGEPDERPELSGGEDPAFARIDDKLALEGLMAPLSEHERLVLRLRFRDDLVQCENAERLGISQCRSHA